MSTPITPPPLSPPPDDYGRGRPSGSGYTTHAVVSLLIGCLFLMNGWPFAQWLMHPSVNPYPGVIWPVGHEKEGQPVTYFELDYGTAWRDMGMFVTAAVLMIEAALFLLLSARPNLAKTVLPVVITLGVVGCAANVLAAVMQFKMGFTQPVFAIVGLIVCVLTIASASQRRRDL